MSKEIENETFENKIVQAQQLLEKLIDPEITLSDSVSVYKEGIKELETAQKLLEEAKLEFKEISN
jgi:exodeoxyribonuclease VII small subunit